MTGIEWETGGGVIQHLPAEEVPYVDLPAGADQLQYDGVPDFHVTLIGRKALIASDDLLSEFWPQIKALLPASPKVELSPILYESRDEGRRTWFLHVENQRELRQFANALSRAIRSVSAGTFENPETHRYFHVSVANNAGGDPLRSIGSIRPPEALRDRTADE